MPNQTSNQKSGKSRKGKTRKSKLSLSMQKEVKKLAANVIDSRDRAERELKCFEVITFNQAISTAPAIIQLTSGMVTGTLQNQRIGNEVSLHNHLIRYSVSSADSTNVVRVIIFRWFGIGVPAGNQILSDAVLAPWLSPLDCADDVDIQVIHDNLMCFDTDDTIFVDKQFRDLSGKAVWNDQGGTVKGQLFMLLVSDSDVSSHPSMTFNSRVKYFDA